MTQLALVIDLNVCVGCQACVTSCKSWNTSGSAGPLADFRPYDDDPAGTFFNRVQTFEVGEFPIRRLCTSPSHACIAKTRRVCRCARLAPATSAKKTAYEMFNRDWSSDVCSSDLPRSRRDQPHCFGALQ